jgi:hypothetical protein
MGGTSDSIVIAPRILCENLLRSATQACVPNKKSQCGTVALTLAPIAVFMLLRFSYGFVCAGVLWWLFTLSCISLLVSVSVWLCVRKLKCDWAKMIVSMICVLLCFIGISVRLFLNNHTLILQRPLAVHVSPEGTNRVIVVGIPFRDEAWVAPMVNRWVWLDSARYKAAAFGMQFWGDISVVWSSEHLAIAELGSRQIVVEFSH